MQLPDIPQKGLVADDGITVFALASAKEFSYHWLVREKKSHPWREAAFAYAPGDCCFAVAQKYFDAAGYNEPDWTCQKLVDGATWLQFQVTQHLREVGIRGPKRSIKPLVNESSLSR